MLSNFDYLLLFFVGTKNVIDACIELKVKRLIYTSSASVVFDGIHGIFNGNESLPYPPKVSELINLQAQLLLLTFSSVLMLGLLFVLDALGRD